jgi:hypothetical protein
MGGDNSGRRRTRNRGAIENMICLDIRTMRRQGFLRPGAVTKGFQSWSYVATGEESGSVGVTVNLENPEFGLVTVRFLLNGDPRVQEISLESRRMRYGGWRYYFLCPHDQRRCEVMPMIGSVFASRQAHRVTYQSQSNDQVSRLREKASKLEKQLWAKDGKPKPRGVRQQRLIEAWDRTDSEFEARFAIEKLRRFGGRS